ncbi:type II toxin-antitoxin system tRNA(fMet)-specific endonuclease VapC [Lacimicrobium alkaliphilum]|uniref:Ribonuclease VapC n=1 Tax=Lacimicrobium alkaliphilum TaxID=1526571 RepID=A0ABQ1RF81_9ALTE|nr:type II toxin-antitoxin system VapC family toxin [Lacimicrobium alkaliphilum]GGD68569.1 nucleic acid-binding protein [Lacimicrobium alkaliphilum]
MYVLDTNTLIYFFKGVGNVSQRLLSVSPKDIGIPSVVVYELEFGIAKSDSPGKRKKQLEEFISLVNILPFSENEAKQSADLRAKLVRKGTPIGPYDILIAGTALAANSILVTNNTKEFSRVDNLRLDNWY